MNTHFLHIDYMAHSTLEDDKKHWVHFDGGPLILLQAHAVTLWKGCDGTNDPESVYDDGSIETDYDFVCYGGDPYSEIELTKVCNEASIIASRYDRDMLILQDSEFSARLFILPSGEVGVVQVQCIVDDFQALMLKTWKETPLSSRPFTMIDDRLRLMAAVDDTSAPMINYSEVPITSGRKLWNYYELENCWIYVISDAVK